MQKPDYEDLNVSRETFERLEAYVALVEKWNPAINIISRSSVAEMWSRHIDDSAQLMRHLPEGAQKWADLGSGGGFPGLVIAIMSKEAAPELRVELVESDQRKATFLRQVIRELNLSATVHSVRIEDCAPLAADVVSARALAPLDVLCGFAARHLTKGGLAIFPKGARSDQEIEVARSGWHFDLEQDQSTTSPESKVLLLRAIKNV